MSEKDSKLVYSKEMREYRMDHNFLFMASYSYSSYYEFGAYYSSRPFCMEQNKKE